MTPPLKTIALHPEPVETAGTPARFNPLSQACAECGIREFALFGAVSMDALEAIHSRIGDLTLAPGDTLYAAQSTGHAVYTVRSGVMRMERVSEGGDRRIIRLVGKTDLLGLETLLHQTYSADAVACTRVELCRIPRAVVEELSQNQAALPRDLMKRWQRALDDADEWLTELTRGTARHRMLRLLLKLSEFGDEAHRIWLPSRQEMGAMLDMTFETASRLISAARREGLLEPLEGRQARLAMPALLDALRQDAAAS